MAPSESPLPLLTNDALLNRGRTSMINGDITRSQSDSALHKHKFSDLLRHRPTFLTRKKSQQTLALHVVPERSSVEQSRQPSIDKVLPPIPVGPVDSELGETVENTEIQRGNNQGTLRRANTEKEMRTVQPAEDPRKVQSADINPDQPPPPESHESTATSEIPKVFELISMEEVPVEPTPVEVESPPEKAQPPKVVCGLPCDSKRRERELNYTLDILTGIRSRKDEEKLRAEAKRLEMKKLELKKAAAAMNDGMPKRKIL
jgi:hypothetical protein